jgi:hypothetical protein
MKKINRFGLVLVGLSVFILSCKDGKYKESISEAVTSDSEKSAPISSSAAVEKNDGKRKFIRTADVKFRVKNVAKSTYSIENTTTKFGGFVTYTNLQSRIHEIDQTAISQDSLLETTKFSVENNMTIRVPNNQLDTVLKCIVKEIDFLDYRLIKADDVALKILTNELEQKRNTEHEKRLENAIDSKGKKLNQIVDAEIDLNTKKEQSDQAKLLNLALEDQINFSTLTLQLYQREVIKRELLPNEKNINAYRPHLGLKIIDGLRAGWYMLEEIIAFIIQLWALILLAGIGIWIYKKYSKSNKPN